MSRRKQAEQLKPSRKRSTLGLFAIAHAEPLDNFRLRLRLTNRMMLVRDFSLLARFGLLGNVTTSERFRRVRLVDDELFHGKAVSWPDLKLFDLSSDLVLWGTLFPGTENGERPARDAVMLPTGTLVERAARAPKSPASPRLHDRPHYISPICDDCMSALKPLPGSHRGGWHDEFWCSRCKSDLHLDVPPSFWEELPARSALR